MHYQLTTNTVSVSASSEEGQKSVDSCRPFSCVDIWFLEVCKDKQITHGFIVVTYVFVFMFLFSCMGVFAVAAIN